MFKPQRARDTAEAELIKLLEKYKQLIVMTKYDGVRCLVENCIVKGKTLLPIPNKYIQSLYGREEYEGKEFELIVTDVNGNYDPVTCCRETVSFTNTLDMVTDHRCILIDNFLLGEFPFEDRLLNMELFIKNHINFQLPDYIIATTIEEILHYEDSILKLDHEAIIVRNPELTYKEGTSSRDGELLRLKRYISEEATITDVMPAFANLNEAKENLLGNMERSSHINNKVAKEEIGKFFCTLVKDIHDPWSGRLIAKKGSSCVVATGNMTKEEKIKLYQEKELLKGRMIKFKSFPKGTKDKPRFATFQYFVPVFDSPT